MQLLPPVMKSIPYMNREDAGVKLAEKLGPNHDRHTTIILGLPRGGVVVAREIARALDLPMDVLMVRKIGFPNQPEVAVGAIASGDTTIINHSIAAELPDPEGYLLTAISIQQKELRRREQLYRAGRPPLDVRRKHVILVDDGLATGATMRAAVQAVRLLGAASCIAAAPVGAVDACRVLANEADQLLCPLIPKDFASVGRFYEDFSEVTEDEVREILAHDPLVPH